MSNQDKYGIQAIKENIQNGIFLYSDYENLVNIAAQSKTLGGYEGSHLWKKYQDVLDLYYIDMLSGVALSPIACAVLSSIIRPVKRNRVNDIWDGAEKMLGYQINRIQFQTAIGFLTRNGLVETRLRLLGPLKTYHLTERGRIGANIIGLYPGQRNCTMPETIFL